MSEKISAMPAASALTGAELVPLVQSGDNKRTTAQAIANLAPTPSGTPTIAGGPGAGTAPTVAITGTDAAGEITVTTDSDTVSSAVFCTVTFDVPFATAPYVVFSPANDNAALLSGDGAQSRALYLNSTTTNFTLNTNSVKEPLGLSEYKFHYHVHQ